MPDKVPDGQIDKVATIMLFGEHKKTLSYMYMYILKKYPF